MNTYRCIRMKQNVRMFKPDVVNLLLFHFNSFLKIIYSIDSLFHSIVYFFLFPLFENHYSL